MRNTFIVVFGFLFMLSLIFFAAASESAASSTKDWEIKWEKLVEAAKGEGKVMVYGRGDPNLRKAMREAFKGKYGIELEFVYFARGGEMASKLKKERSAGLFLADIIIHGPTTMTYMLKPAGILEKMEPVFVRPEFSDPNLWLPGYYFMDKDRMMKPLAAHFNTFIIRNTNLTKKGEINSLEDLIDPKWKGKIVMGDPTRPGSASGMLSWLEGIWGFEKTERFLRQLVKQEPVISRQVRVPVEWLARGKYTIGIAMRAESLPEFYNLGSPIAAVRPIEGCYLTPGSGIVAIANKRPHPNAAAVFINWLLSREGQITWSKADGFASARVDVPSDDWVHIFFKRTPGEKVFVEDEEVINKRAKLMKLAKQLFGPLLK
ncbi:ABC transporter substrate-binding protein [Thermodesulfobacteriota bacterium]